jgi:hypothetical protein
MSELDNGVHQPDLAGYPSTEELVKGYRSSSEEAKRQRNRADQLEQRMATLEQQFQPRPQVPTRADASSRLAEYGVPVDALDEYVSSRVSAGVAAAFEPVLRGATARNSMLSTYSDYQTYEADVARFIQDDPNLSQKYQRMFAADPEAAMEFAYLKFGQTRRAAVPANGNGAQQVARAEAQIPSNRTGDARNQPAAADENIARGWDHFQKTGNPTAFAKARLRQVIPDEFLAR